jgi:hypothetical protein
MRPPGPKDDDPRLLCTIQEVKEKSVIFMVSLRTWAKGATYIYGLILVLISTFMIIQDFTTLNPRNTFKLKTALTETAAGWVSSDSFPVGIRPQVLNGFGTSGSCSLFNGVNYTSSGMYVQSVSFFFSHLDALVLVLSIMVFCFLSHFVIVFKELSYYSPFKTGNGHIGVYIERSVSVPLIFMILCAQAGITDVWTLSSLLTNAWGSMLFSFFAEVLFQGDGGFLDVSFYKIARDDERADTNSGGGCRFWADGVAHYHAIAMFASCVHYVMVVLILFSNRRISDSCLRSVSSLPWYIVLSIIVMTVIYGLILVVQTLTMVLKLKPSTLKIFLAESENPLWDENGRKSYVQDYEDGKKQRTLIAIWLEFFYIVLDCSAKIVLFLGVFVMGSLVS